MGTPSSLSWLLDQNQVTAPGQNQWWATSLVTEPADEPVTLKQAKDHMRTDRTDEDERVWSYVRAARTHLEQVCGRSFMPQTWDLWLQRWPGGNRIFLPWPPVQSVLYVKYVDQSETLATVDPATYVANLAGDYTEVVLRFGLIWPAVVLSPSRAINIRFTAGYDRVPETLKHAILLLAGHWYMNRESVITEGSSARNASVLVPQTVDMLVANYRMYGYSPDPLRS